MTLVEKVKLALRISHTLLDADIAETITLARAEMTRAGVNPALSESDNPLVEGAIKTFCLSKYTDKDKAESYFESWQYQLDNLRKSTVEE